MGARTHGFIEISSPDGRVEIQTFTCAHCSAIRVMPQKDEPYGFCNNCMANTCATPECGNECVPFMRKIEKMEARGRLLRALGL